MPERPATKTSKAGRTRRVAKHAAPRRWDALRRWAAKPSFLPTLVVGVGLFVAVALTIKMGQGRLLVAEGRVMDRTRIVRVEFQLPDEAATERAREARRLSSPRIYVVDERVRQDLQQSLAALPASLQAAAAYEEVAEQIRTDFALTPEQFTRVKEGADAFGDAESWSKKVASVMQFMLSRPLLTTEEYQLALNAPSVQVELRLPDGTARAVNKSTSLHVGGDLLQQAQGVLRSAGISGVAGELVGQRLTSKPRALFVFDRAATEDRQEREAAAAPVQMVTYRQGDVIGRRGETLGRDQYEVLAAENRAFRDDRSGAVRALEWAGVAGTAGVIVAALALFLRLIHSWETLGGRRLIGLAALVAAGSLVATWTTVMHPEMFWLEAVGAVLLATMIAAVALDPRTALGVAATQAAVVAAALLPPIGFFVVVLASAGLASWRLREIRSRNDVVAAAVMTALLAATSTALVNLLTRPPVPEVWGEVAADAVRAGIGGFLAGALLLVVLPSVEKIFDVVTGMTLSELRDPKQTLLRRLQQQAPGTFNHSHTVATLAEAAADAIGADGLHLYVGALYHDIGKMNKPDYFVENQARGLNRHSKLSPAMSLLVIVGHVKDGMELAREYALPRSLHGYIASHHGTTLVEYFYDQARRQAEDEDSEDIPEEIEYRYPGPKPRTREQAILMISDAVESATRAMPEPTPSRIASLVHTLATKRLMDGQFDECNLTLRELRLIEDAITKTLSAIYHGRIAYPGAEPRETPRDSDSRVAAEQAG